MYKFLFRFFSILFLIMLGISTAQETVPVPVEEPSEQTTPETEVADTDLVFDEGDETDPQISEEATESTSERFIPTEQISQDLGVSFPADI